MVAMTAGMLRLESAKALLARSRLGAKAVVALGVSEVHVRIGLSSDDPLTFGEDEPTAVLAVHLAAVGLRLMHPDAPDAEIRDKAVTIAADLARRFPGEVADAVEAFLRANGPLSLHVLAAHRRRENPLPRLRGAALTELEAGGSFYLGPFSVAGTLCAGDPGYLSSKRASLRLAARAGVWHAFARRYEPDEDDPTPDDTVGMLFACHADEIPRCRELIDGGQSAGEVPVDSGAFALVDSSWSDRFPLDKWMDEVDHPSAPSLACSVGENGCMCVSGYGDGHYEVVVLADRSGQAVLVGALF
jgi:hypothetical protein